jgi:hypothetical protein
MASISELRAGIAANLATIPGLRSAPEIPDNPNPPVAIVSLDSVTYDRAYAKGMVDYNFTVTVIVGRAAERIAQRTLDTYISTGQNSIKNAIELDKSLGGKAFDCRVTSLNSVGSIQLNDNTYLAADFTVSVIAN